MFESLSEGWTILDESKVSADFSLDYIKSKMPAKNQSRACWYYQQLLKIQALLNSGKENEKLLIWDADTIPLQPLQFFIEDKAVYFTGSEFHKPYFDSINKLLHLDKSVNFSFIAQCFPTFSRWLQEFKSHVECAHNKPWFDAILDSTNLDEPSGFSEYETLGTFFVRNFAQNMAINHQTWERLGEKITPIEKVLNLETSENLPAYISYECWNPTAIVPKACFKKPCTENEFLDLFFKKSELKKSVTQVGANDGKMCDPLSPFLTSSRYNDVQAILIEPLEFYFEKCKKLHHDRPNTLVLKGAVDSKESMREFYYIDPMIASEMNGDGPLNDWAHGQGSFCKDRILFWIEENTFRGITYSQNIEKYRQSIIKTHINCFPLKNISLSNDTLNLLLIDTQGAELNVLLGVDWTRPPDFIIYEQDIERDNLIEELLTSLGYNMICGSVNLLFCNSNTILMLG
jgi:FkbM family methyltransferase